MIAWWKFYKKILLTASTSAANSPTGNNIFLSLLQSNFSTLLIISSLVNNQRKTYRHIGSISLWWRSPGLLAVLKHCQKTIEEETEDLHGNRATCMNSEQRNEEEAGGKNKYMQRRNHRCCCWRLSVQAGDTVSGWAGLWCLLGKGANVEKGKKCRGFCLKRLTLGQYFRPSRHQVQVDEATSLQM